MLRKTEVSPGLQRAKGPGLVRGIALGVQRLLLLHWGVDLFQSHAQGIYVNINDSFYLPHCQSNHVCCSRLEKDNTGPYNKAGKIINIPSPRDEMWQQDWGIFAPFSPVRYCFLKKGWCSCNGVI